MILIGLVVYRQVNRLLVLEKKKFDELSLDKTELENEVQRRTEELAQKAEIVLRANKELEDSNILLKATNQQLHSANVRTTQVLNRITEIERSNIRKLKHLFNHPSINQDLRRQV